MEVSLKINDIRVALTTTYELQQALPYLHVVSKYLGKPVSNDIESLDTTKTFSMFDVEYDIDHSRNIVSITPPQDGRFPVYVIEDTIPEEYNPKIAGHKHIVFYYLNNVFELIYVTPRAAGFYELNWTSRRSNKGPEFKKIEQGKAKEAWRRFMLTEKGIKSLAGVAIAKLVCPSDMNI